ncbi:hypothetical protein [Tenacibaculum singaporense]|uniref:hypothetical protein n=1 Tax=Tenacibaculum singaporense TaxID=2358479 RepID=UPI0035110804
MKIKNLFNIEGVTTLSNNNLKSIQGGFADPDGLKREGDLCNTRGPAKNRCGAGLTCDAGHIGIGICK